MRATSSEVVVFLRGGADGSLAESAHLTILVGWEGPEVHCYMLLWPPCNRKWLEKPGGPVSRVLSPSALRGISIRLVPINSSHRLFECTCTIKLNSREIFLFQGSRETEEWLNSDVFFFFFPFPFLSFFLDQCKLG